MAIEWTEELSVGVDAIDKQHQHFISIINELYTALDENRANEAIEKLLDDLTTYADYHFATEEKYFEMFKYKGAEEHIAIHNEMRAKLKHLKSEQVAGNQKVVIETLYFLENWLKEHLQKEDRKYIDCFHDHGLV